MREISKDQLKRIELEILKCIRDYCNTNDIRYFLGYGTLIGAVRHQGFIPWDDDIDICMPREDYLKFIDNFNDNNNRYTLMCMENTKPYYLPFAKVIDTKTVVKETVVRSVPNMGVYVDIFPIDGLGNSVESAKKRIDKCKKKFSCMQYASYLYYKPRTFKNILKNVMIYSQRKLLRHNYKYICLEASKNTIENSKYAGVIFGFYGHKEIMPSCVVREYKKCLFENNEYLIPSDYNTYLTTIYGDYLKLPPKEKQITHHSFIAYYKG